MPKVAVDKLVIHRDAPGVKDRVEGIIEEAKRHSGKDGKGVYQRSKDQEFVGVGKLYCEYGVVGAWNVAAKCEVVSDSGETLAWLGWYMDYEPHSSDEGTNAPLEYSFCYSPELYKMGKLYIYDEKIGEKLKEALENPEAKYVCIEGWVDDPEYFVARSQKEMAELARKFADRLGDLGLGL